MKDSWRIKADEQGWYCVLLYDKEIGDYVCRYKAETFRDAYMWLYERDE